MSIPILRTRYLHKFREKTIQYYNLFIKCKRKKYYSIKENTTRIYNSLINPIHKPKFLQIKERKPLGITTLSAIYSNKTQLVSQTQYRYYCNHSISYSKILILQYQREKPLGITTLSAIYSNKMTTSLSDSIPILLQPLDIIFQNKNTSKPKRGNHSELQLSLQYTQIKRQLVSQTQYRYRCSRSIS